MSGWIAWENEWEFDDLVKEYRVRKLNIDGLPVRQVKRIVGVNPSLPLTKGG